jgi:hypothetical protein
VLTPESVANIHHEGGSVLGAGRGGDLEKAFPFFEKYDIDQVRGIARAACATGVLCVLQVCCVCCVCAVRVLRVCCVCVYCVCAACAAWPTRAGLTFVALSLVFMAGCRCTSLAAMAPCGAHKPCLRRFRSAGWPSR